MKNLLLFLSVVGCLVPAFSHADVPLAKSKRASHTVAKPVVVAKPAPKRDRIVYYITNETRVGSLIPMVYRSYGGRIDSASSPAVYGTTAIAETGTLDVGTALYKLDPSFTVGRGR